MTIHFLLKLLYLQLLVTSSGIRFFIELFFMALLVHPKMHGAINPSIKWLLKISSSQSILITNTSFWLRNYHQNQRLIAQHLLIFFSNHLDVDLHTNYCAFSNPYRSYYIIPVGHKRIYPVIWKFRDWSRLTC